MDSGKLQMGLCGFLLAIWYNWLSFRYCSIKARFVQWMTSCPGCGSLQFIQSWSFGWIFDQCCGRFLILLYSFHFRMMCSIKCSKLNAPLRPSQNSFICNKIKLHTGRLYSVLRGTFDHSAIIRQLLKAFLTGKKSKTGQLTGQNVSWTLLCPGRWSHVFI